MCFATLRRNHIASPPSLPLAPSPISLPIPSSALRAFPHLPNPHGPIKHVRIANSQPVILGPSANSRCACAQCLNLGFRLLPFFAYPKSPSSLRLHLFFSNPNQNTRHGFIPSRLPTTQSTTCQLPSPLHQSCVRLQFSAFPPFCRPPSSDFIFIFKITSFRNGFHRAHFSASAGRPRPSRLPAAAPLPEHRPDSRVPRFQQTEPPAAAAAYVPMSQCPDIPISSISLPISHVSICCSAAIDILINTH